ncbi:hypothetical protein IJ425_07040, partial [bacterium]|nr:hypothetical protein [bacterium]
MKIIQLLLLFIFFTMNTSGIQWCEEREFIVCYSEEEIEKYRIDCEQHDMHMIEDKVYLEDHLPKIPQFICDSQDIVSVLYRDEEHQIATTKMNSLKTTDRFNSTLKRGAITCYYPNQPYYYPQSHCTQCASVDMSCAICDSGYPMNILWWSPTNQVHTCGSDTIDRIKCTGGCATVKA